jgi:hypothetical protein
VTASTVTLSKEPLYCMSLRPCIKKPGNHDSLFALFAGKTVITLDKCRRNTVEDDFEPVWMRPPDANFLLYTVVRISLRKLHLNVGRTGHHR